MTDEQFETLSGLIRAVVYYRIEVHSHPNDQPRNAMMLREMQEAEQHARSVLVDVDPLS